MRAAAVCPLALLALFASTALSAPARAQFELPHDAGRVDAGTGQPDGGTAAAALVLRLGEDEEWVETSRETLSQQDDVGTIRSHVAPSTSAISELDAATKEEQLEQAGRSVIRESLRRAGGIASDLRDDTERLAAVTEEVDEIRADAERRKQAWAAARDTLDPSTPPAFRAQLSALLRSLDELIELARERSLGLLALQAELADLEGRADTIVGRLEAAQSRSRAAIFQRVSLPIWADRGDGPDQEPRIILTGASDRFFEVYGSRLPVDGFLAALFLGVVLWLSRWARRVDPAVADLAVLERPLAAALIVVLVSMRFIYPQAPAAVFHGALIAALLPLARLIPVLLKERALHAPTWVFMAFFATQEAAAFLDISGLLRRWISLGVTVGLIALIVVIFRRGGPRVDEDATRVERAIPHILRVIVALLGVAVLAEAVGYTELGRLLTNGLLLSVYVLFVLIAAVRVLAAVFIALIRSPTGRLSLAARSHGSVIERRATKILKTATAIVWGYVVLVIFGLVEVVEGVVGGALEAEVGVGSWTLSLRDVVVFGFVVWATAYLARFIGFVLDDEVLPRMTLPRGAPSTVSRLTRYGIWALGFLLAVASAGVDMGSITLLVSALGVGIGFGLQNIVNNFVSGLILIFERPVREGDTIEVGGILATVKRIGIRASVVHTFNGAEVIVPNADLISAPVTNWTLSDQLRRVDLPVGVAYGTDPEKVLAILLESVVDVPDVVTDPAPQAIFRAFGASSLDFELRFWVTRGPDWPLIASLVIVRINKLLTEAGIEIPFPQTDLHVRSIDADVASALRKA